MTAPPPRPTRRPVAHAAARSRVGVAVGSIAVCVGLTGGLAWQHLGASASAAAPAQRTTAAPANGSGYTGGNGDDGYGDDGNGFVPATLASTSSHGS